MQHHSLLKPEHPKKLFLEAIQSNTPISSALLLCDLASILGTGDEKNAKEIALICNLPHTTTLYYLKNLKETGFLSRRHARAWQLSERTVDILHDPRQLEDTPFLDTLLSNMGPSTAKFFEKCLPYLSKDETVSARYLSIKTGYALSGAIIHLKRLSIKNYVVRVKMNAWSLGDNGLKFK